MLVEIIFSFFVFDQFLQFLYLILWSDFVAIGIARIMLSVMIKHLSLLRAQPENTKTSVPLENVSNQLRAVANVFHQRQQMPKWITRLKVRKSKRVQPFGKTSRKKAFSSRCQWQPNSTRELNKETGQKKRNRKKKFS